ncbi:MAG: SprB repeat-containing protein [Bacteroidales bacterium]|nr:SprB repeat-containing protein [Bacteroidales bacterium]
MHNKISKLCFVIIYISVFFGINTKKVYSQLVIEKTVTSDAILQDIVKNVLVGSGVEVSNITATGWFDNDGTGQLGSFSTGSSSTNLGIAKGILLSTGKIQDAKGPNNSTNKMFQWYNATGDKNSDSDLEMITGSTGSSRDAAILEFDFKPAATPLRFKYVFASEEYPEYVCSFYNDIFAFFLTGPKPGGGSYNKQNIAIIPGTSLPVAINSVNSGNPGIDPISGVRYDKNDCISTNYNNYYINNNGGATIQYDGFTKVLIATAEVIPCQTYHIKLAIADFYDDKYDSGVFLEANSFSSDATSVNVAYTIPSLGTSLYEGCNKTIITFSTSQSSSVDKSINFTLTGTATRGTDYSLNTNNDFVTIKAGETQTQLEITGKADGMDEGDETIIIKVETSACAFETYTITLKDYKEMTITPGSDKTICEGQSADINSSATGGVAPYQYKWSNSAGTTATVKVSPVETTTYTVTINDVCQATATTSVKVNVNPLPKNVFNKAKDQICFGDSVKITSIPSNGKAPYSFLWNNNSTSDNINIINKSTDEIIKKITYKIKITDNNNCFIDDSLSLSLIPQFKVLNTTDSVCLGECTGKITLNVKGGNGTYTYLWNNNKTTKDIDSLCAKDYFVTITDGVGCTYKSEKIAINALTLDTSYTIT